jgi:hypothetical protein
VGVTVGGKGTEVASTGIVGSVVGAGVLVEQAALSTRQVMTIRRRALPPVVRGIFFI